MAEPTIIDDSVDAEAGAVGLALLLSDTHAAIIAAGDEILAMTQVVAHSIGTLPNNTVPLLAEPNNGQSRDENTPVIAAHPIEPTASARRNMSAQATVASVTPLLEASLARFTIVPAGSSPAAPSLTLAQSVQDWVGPPDNDMPPLSFPSTPTVPETMAPVAPTSPVDYAAYAPASHDSNFQQTSVLDNSVTSHDQQPIAADVSPTMPSIRMPAQPALTAANGIALASAGRPPIENMETASSPTVMHGDVFLDGVRVGRWLSDKLARAANAPPSGSTAFDPRMGPTWPGTQQGH